LFARAGLPAHLKSNFAQRKKLFAAMMLDKKVSSGEIRFVLARKIGCVEFGKIVPAELIEPALS
jgi:3-dehydroquinate synthetase